MASSSGKSFKFALELGGRVASSLGASFARANTALSKLQSHARRVSVGMSHYFKGTGTSIRGSFVTSIGKATVALGALAAAMIGIKSIGSFISEAIEAFKDEGLVASARQIHAALMNNQKLAKQGTAAINEQMEAFKKLGESMSSSSGIGQGVFQAAFSRIAMAGGGEKEMAMISQGFKDYLVANKGFNATKEDSTDLANKLATAVNRGNLGRFTRELQVTKDQAKQFQALKTAAERLKWLNTALEKRYGGQAKEAIGSEAGKNALAKVRRKEILAEYGKVFYGIQTRWTRLSNEMMAAFLPIMKPMLNQLQKGFDQVLGVVDKIKTSLSDSRVGAQMKLLGDNLTNAFNSLSSSPAWNRFISFFDKGLDVTSVVDALKDVSAELVNGTGPAGEILNIFRSLKSAVDFVEGSLTNFQWIGKELADNWKEAKEIGAELKSNWDELILDIGKIQEGWKGVVTGIQSAVTAVENFATGVKNAASAVLVMPKSGLVAPTSNLVAPQQHAKGGIVTRPHIGMVGEAGPEAIIPLKRGGNGIGGKVANLTVNYGGITINGVDGIHGAVSHLKKTMADHASKMLEHIKAADHESYRTSLA